MHFSFLIDKYTFQDQNPAARLITVLDVEFQSLSIFQNVEYCQGWPLENKWPLKLFGILFIIMNQYNYNFNRLSIFKNVEYCQGWPS